MSSNRPRNEGSSNPTETTGAERTGSGDGDLVGPYRLEQRVGSGGMGTVFRGVDTRLGRAVALKRVRADFAGNPSARRRLRREARAVARLSHPAIVPIFDFVEAPEGDWIVMEWVDGEPMSESCRRGLEVAAILALGHQIAEGLAEAHDKSLVHRDLKLENVMVTRGARARILDFGLARRVESGDGQPGDSVSRLTASGALVGTYRAMAPEQVRGRAIDGRADLFALGVLLYEALSGSSPFGAETPYDVLHRIVEQEPLPLSELAPGLPDGVHRLVDQLLQKDPARRPQHAAEVAEILAALASDPGAASPATPSTLPRFEEEKTLGRAAPALRSVGSAGASTAGLGSPESAMRAGSRRRRWRVAIAALIMLAALAAWLAAPGFRAAPSIYVAALPPVVEGSSDDETHAVAMALEIAGQRALLALEGISLLAPEQVATSLRAGIPTAAGTAAPPPDRTPHQVAAILGVDDLITSLIRCEARTCRIVLARTEGSRGLLLYSHPLEVPTSDPLLLETAVAGAIERAFPEHGWRRGRPALMVDRDDYRLFLDWRRSFLAGAAKADGGLQMLSDLESMMHRSPRFVDAFLLAARLARQRFFDTRDPADLARARELAHRARDLAPEDPRTWMEIVDVEAEADETTAARRALEALDELQPGHVDLQIRRAFVLQREGRQREALELMRAAAQTRPSTRRLFDLANLELRLGEISGARSNLEQLLERDPGSYIGRALLAETELLHGSATRAAALWHQLALRSPSYANVSNHGLALLLAGEPVKAAVRFAAATQKAPRNATAWLNLADVHWLTDRRDEAADLYRHALELAESDPDPENWAQLLVRAQALARLGDPGGAVSVLQRALKASPDNPEVAYIAALVHAIAGEEASAEAHLERALQLGVSPRWFFFPEFDSLRGPGRPLPPRDQPGNAPAITED